MQDGKHLGAAAATNGVLAVVAALLLGAVGSGWGPMSPSNAIVVVIQLLSVMLLEVRLWVLSNSVAAGAHNDVNVVAQEAQAPVNAFNAIVPGSQTHELQGAMTMHQGDLVTVGGFATQAGGDGMLNVATETVPVELEQS